MSNLVQRRSLTFDKKNWSVQSTSGLKASYELVWVKKKKRRGLFKSRQKKGFYLKKASVSRKPLKDYEVVSNSYTNLLKVSKIKRPEGRFLQVAYSSNRQDGSKGRVESLSNAIGTQARFRYAKNRTSVTDALGRKSRFFFSNKRLEKKEERLPSGETLRTFRFQWDKKGKLCQKTVSGEGAPSLDTCYAYDQKGRVTQKKLLGNLTGRARSESRIYRYTHAADGRDLLLKEELPNGSEVRYDYLEKTNLPVSKRVFADGVCQERLFTRYDSNSIPVEIIRDDGSGERRDDLSEATYRTIQEIAIELDPQAPGFLQPKEIRKSYLDLATGEKILLRRVELLYHPCRKVAEKRVFGSDGSCYSKCYDYNDLLQVTRKQSALGEATLYAYDANGNLISEEKEGSGKKIACEYDKGDRLVCEIESYEEGLEQVTSHTYDALNNRTLRQRRHLPLRRLFPLGAGERSFWPLQEVSLRRLRQSDRRDRRRGQLHQNILHEPGRRV